MKKSRRIIFLCVLSFLAVFLATAEGQQETNPLSHGGPQKGNKQSRGHQMDQPPKSELTLLRLQFFIETADAEPSLSLSDEQIRLILPILEDWSAAIEADETVDSEAFVASINEILTNEQRSFLPQPHQPPSGGSGGDRPKQGERPEPPAKPSISEILAKLTDTLSGMI